MKKALLPALLFGLAVMPALAVAGPSQSRANGSADQHTQATRQQAKANSSDMSKNVKDALGEVTGATATVKDMRKDPGTAELLDRAKGVFILPDYGRAGLGIGGSGGQGVLLAKTNGTWSDPVFYNIGSVSLGLQAGVSAGRVAMILLTDQAVNSFKGNTSFSLNADAELTIVNYSERGQANLGKADVVFWTNVEGAYAGVTASASAVSADGDANHAYYGTPEATPGKILNGTVSKARPEATQLKDALNA
jgi:SH3 domain-containing YSC84-like protein 1